MSAPGSWWRLNLAQSLVQREPHMNKNFLVLFSKRNYWLPDVDRNALVGDAVVASKIVLVLPPSFDHLQQPLAFAEQDAGERPAGSPLMAVDG
jgi:hypothetical protein